MDFFDECRQEQKFFGLTNDVVFKIVFSSPGNERLLVLLLNALLQLKGKDQIEGLEILNPFNLPEFRTDKFSIIDVRARDRAGNKYCIEVQMRSHKELMKRIVYYSSVSYARQLAKGGSYADLNKTICLWIMGETIIDEAEIYNKFLISHAETHKPLTDLIEYHFVELSKFKQEKPAKLRSKFEKWLHLIKFGELYRSAKDLPEDLKSENGITEVVSKMAVANTNEHLREVMISREMFLIDINTDKQAARKEGKEEGRAEGKAEGKVEGKAEGKVETAMEMLADKLPVEVIAKYTGLKVEQIEKLATNKNQVSEPATVYKPSAKTAPRKGKEAKPGPRKK